MTHTRLPLILGLLVLVITGATGVAAVWAADHGPPGGLFGVTLSGGDNSNGVQLRLESGYLVPGDVVSSSQVIENVGDRELRYALATASTNGDGKDLRGVLQLTIKTADLGPSARAGTCDRFDGTTLSSNVLGPGHNAFGNIRTGADAGDRTLGPGQRETLCFQFRLPLEAGNQYQGSATTTTLRFEAEQTAGNP